MITSGIRLGTPALTTRGMKPKDMDTIAHLINEVLENIDNEKKIKSIGRRVKTFASQFPLYYF